MQGFVHEFPVSFLFARRWRMRARGSRVQRLGTVRQGQGRVDWTSREARQMPE
jgi:hypothetical protein